MTQPRPPWEAEDLARLQEREKQLPPRVPVTPIPKTPPPRKDPVIAALLGGLSPGSGQLWVGSLRRGLLAFATSFLCGVGYFWGIYDAYQLAVKANRGEFAANNKYTMHAYFTLPTILVAIIVGAAGYAVWREWEMIQNYFATLAAILAR